MADERMRDAELQEAVARNDLTHVRQLLQQEGADVNLGGGGGGGGGTASKFDALHFACLHNCDAALVAELLAHGANPDARTSLFRDVAPLHICASRNRLETARLLLRHGANPDVPTFDWARTPLQTAAATGHLDMVRLLLDHGADVNTVDDAGFTAAHHAIDNFERAVADVLLSHRDVDATIGSWTVLHRVAAKGWDEHVRLILDHASDGNQSIVIHQRTTPEGYTPFLAACLGGSAAAAQRLVDAGSDIGAVDQHGNTALHVAARSGDEETLRVAIGLLSEKQVDQENKAGLTPLAWACKHGQYGMVECLLRKGRANPNPLTTASQVPIILAARTASTRMVSLLLQYGARIDQEDKEGRCAIHIAAMTADQDMLHLCLQHGASIHHASSPSMMTPLHASVIGLNQDILMMAILLELGADVNARGVNGLCPLHLAVQDRKLERARILIEDGADVNAVSETPYPTPLHMACATGDMDMVQLLLVSAAKVNASFATAFPTPLHVACAAQSRSRDMVQLLLDHGAQNLTPSPALSPVHAAAAAATKESWEVIQILHKRGFVEVETILSHGLSPIVLAARRGNSNLVMSLLQWAISSPGAHIWGKWSTRKDEYTRKARVC